MSKNTGEISDRRKTPKYKKQPDKRKISKNTGKISDQQKHTKIQETER